MVELKAANTVLAYHDRSDGGALIALLEMAFAARCGLEIDVDSTPEQAAALHKTNTLFKKTRYVEQHGGGKPIHSILIANNGMAATKAASRSGNDLFRRSRHKRSACSIIVSRSARRSASGSAPSQPNLRIAPSRSTARECRLAARKARRDMA